ncbi:hypothetical protein K6Y31_18655 [Motilimonas cestriensis]|uniref:Uncharacterized protein n=1 Tax=Motilimonas cestriensis TaxID=2742685 RepID=A0ABS8WF87_9GAMM|nr:hypothetical protein [Motilimonas cestriensis]MCE2596802.1 hypothetical protein [Motilimonas cestriensis]
MKIDRKMRWVARIFFVAFSFVVIRMLFEGGYGYTSAGESIWLVQPSR